MQCQLAWDDVFINEQHKKYIHLYLSIYLSISIQKFEYDEKGQYFLTLISESETHILYSCITQSEIFQAFIYWHFEDYGLQIMKTQNSVF